MVSIRNRVKKKTLPVDGIKSDKLEGVGLCLETQYSGVGRLDNGDCHYAVWSRTVDAAGMIRQLAI